MTANALLFVAILGSFTSTIFLVLVVVAAYRFRKKSHPELDRQQFVCPVSILKPVHGMEPTLEENLEGFFQQNYPQYEIVFCARHAKDPALQIAERLARKYPKVNTQIITSGESPWTNAKVYSLHKMAATAKYDTLVISDSDVRVTANYLNAVTGPLAEKNVGLVTCIYRGVPVKGFWSLLEALGMSVEMTSGVLIANMLEGMKFALGPTMVTRKRCLEQIGGFTAMADYCADDYLLGSRIAEAGYKVVLSDHVVEHIVMNRSLWLSLRHQVRWMKSTRFSRPKGHLGTLFTFAVPFGIFGLVAGGLRESFGFGLGLFVWSLVNPTLQSIIAGWAVTRDTNALRYAPLYPLRALIGFCVWCASYTGRTIDWRGEKFRLAKGGLMLRRTERPAIAQKASAANPN